MPVVKLLNGDLITIENVTPESVGQFLNIKPRHVNLVSITSDDQNPSYLALIDKSVRYKITSPKELTRSEKFSAEWMNCTNPDVLKWCAAHLKSHFLPNSTLFKNPNEVIVDGCITLLTSSNSTEVPAAFFANSSDKALDFLFDHPQLISHVSMYLNTNRRAVDYVMDTVRHELSVEPMTDKAHNLCVHANLLLVQPYEDVLHFAIECFAKVGIKRATFEFADRAFVFLKKNPCSFARELLVECFDYVDKNSRHLYLSGSSIGEDLERYIMEGTLDMDDIGSDEEFATFLSNPHPVAVKWILSNLRDRLVNINSISSTQLNYLSQNTADEIVEMLTDRFQSALGSLAANSNPKIVDMLLNGFLKTWDTLPIEIRQRLQPYLKKNDSAHVGHFVLTHIPSLSFMEKIHIVNNIQTYMTHSASEYDREEVYVEVKSFE